MTPAGARPTDDPQAAARTAAGAQREAPGAELDAPAADAGHEAPVVGAEAGGVGGEVRTPWRGWDPAIRVAGVVISIVAALLSGFFEVLLSTLRAGDLVTVWRGDPIGSGSGPLLGVSVLLAIVGNLGIAWFAVSTTRRGWALGPPWALRTLLMLFAAGVRTHEGDYLLTGDNWVALVMILMGSLAFALYAYRMIIKGIVRP